MASSNDLITDPFQDAPSFETWSTADKFINRLGTEIRSGLYLKDRSWIVDAIIDLNTNKLDTLTAGTGISIDGDVISATNGFTLSSSANSISIIPTTTNNITNYDIEINAPISPAMGGTGAQTLTGLIKGNGTDAMTAAVAGVDYLAPSASVESATKLTTARNLQVDLSQISAELFDGTADATSIGVKGLLDETNGGTGLSQFIPEKQYALPFASATTFTDLNELTTGKYFIPSTQTMTNEPFTGYDYFVVQFPYETTATIQIAYPLESTLSPVYRYELNAIWSTWAQFATNTSQTAVTSNDSSLTVRESTVNGVTNFDVSAESIIQNVTTATNTANSALTTANAALPATANAVSATTLELQTATGDWNNYTTSGLYYGTGLLNSTTGVSLVQVINDGNGNVYQVGYNSSTGTLTVRWYSSSNWQPWSNLAFANGPLQNVIAQDATRLRTQIEATSATNLNTLGQNSIHVASTITPLGTLPVTGLEYTLYQFYSSATAQQQIAIVSSNGRMYTRSYTGAAWTSWMMMFNNSQTIPVANGGTGAATLTGLVKGNGTSAMTAAVAGTDYMLPFPVGSIIMSNSSSSAGMAGGKWTSIGAQTIGSTTVYYWGRTA